MSYTDFKNLSAPLVAVGTATFGALASAAVGTVAAVGNKAWLAGLGAMNLGVGPNPGSVTCLVAPGTSMIPCTVAIMDGTSTIATAVVSTFTANQTVALTKVAGAAVAANDTITANEPTRDFLKRWAPNTPIHRELGEFEARLRMDPEKGRCGTAGP